MSCNVSSLFFIPYEIVFGVWSGNVTAAVPKCARSNDGLFILGSQSVLRVRVDGGKGYDT